jgi:hypothetical protein
MNTAITYEYRDGANYRFHNTLIFAGEMTAELWARLLATLNEEVVGGFIADQVDLPQVFGYLGGKHIDSDEHKNSGYEYDEQNDHCWHRFADDPGSWELTEAQPTDKRTVRELVGVFEAAVQKGWKVFDPGERFGL